ncbi:MAG: type II toxin-antitoxin system RelE/ParE family toxin [Alphaproteobacteria bacterium]
MARYRLTVAADSDLSDIALYGIETFGAERAERYLKDIERRFEDLAAAPYLYPAIDHIRPGYRRSVCGVHSIYYRLDGEDVEIVRVLRSQDRDKRL